MKEALFWTKENDKVRCTLCPHSCLLPDGSIGICHVRKNIDGSLVTLIYGETTSIALDPIEKKPLYHFYPGRSILSTGTNGCNLSCSFCQNYEISQSAASKRNPISPAQLIKLAKNNGAIGIAYTYNEPSVWYEFVLDTSKLAKKAGIRNVLVTNGFINEKPLKELLEFTDALNIDIKAFNGTFYKNLCKGDINEVKRSIEIAVKSCHVELTNLLIPNQNDNIEEIKEMAKWIAGISPEIPLHFSRYFPMYKTKIPPTPVPMLETARLLAKEYLAHVYIGNAETKEGNDTYCSSCKKLLISRNGYAITNIKLNGSKCGYCGTKLYGQFSDK